MSLEYLRKLAKDRLREMRLANPTAKLAEAQLDVAREQGFPSWRALKAEYDRRQAPLRAAFFKASATGDLAAVRSLLQQHPFLVHERDRDDNATALHLAAANGHLEVVRALLDAGADVHGRGDVHKADVIGWAVGNGPATNPELLTLLLDRGAKHHIFSAIAVRDRDLVQSLVEENPEVLSQRRSRFEDGQTPLHFALAAPNGLAGKAPDYEMADLLIELGADVNAQDDRGRTPLAIALLHNDHEAIRRLRVAGAHEPPRVDASALEQRLDELRQSIEKQATPMLCVADADAAVAWYQAVGFTVHARYPDEGPIEWAAMSFGSVEFMLQPRGNRPHNAIALWFATSRIEELYQLFRGRQATFLEDLYAPFYGGQQFSVRDVNGFELVFKSE